HPQISSRTRGRFMSKGLQLVLCALLGAAAFIAAHADECKFTAERTGGIAVAGAKRVEIRAVASAQTLLEQIQIKITRAGDVIHVDVQMPDTEAMEGRSFAMLDLHVDL